MLFVATGPAISNSVESPDTTKLFDVGGNLEISNDRVVVTQSAEVQFEVYGSFTGSTEETLSGDVLAIRVTESEDGVVYTGNSWMYPSVALTWDALKELTYEQAFASNDLGEGGANDDVIAGYGGDDRLWGRQGDDSLIGGDGNDVLIGGNGNDNLDGGNGIDTASYNGAESGVRVDLNIAGEQDTRGHGFDTLLNIENLTGSEFNDALLGDDGNNELRGAGGNDILRGRVGKDFLDGQNGDDFLFGGAGNDTLTGGSGADTFVFDSKPNALTNVDAITDFQSGVDGIQLDNDFFTAMGFVGDATNGDFFRTGAIALDASDRIIYNSNTGALYYDADGVGGAAQVKFAMLGDATHPTLDFSDISVIE